MNMVDQQQEVEQLQESAGAPSEGEQPPQTQTPDDDDHNTAQRQPPPQQEHQTEEFQSTDKDDDATKIHKSHFQRKDIFSPTLRWFIPLWVTLTTILLVVSSIGSGVRVDYVVLRDGEVVDKIVLVTASIFSAVRELWDNGSYPLAIFMCLMSVAWPYLKLLLSVAAWTMPYRNPRRREWMIELLDSLDKWSFVDVFVFVEIMTAFRQTLTFEGSAIDIEVVVVAEWGLYVFILASMMSLITTHVIVHAHRKRTYHFDNDRCDLPEDPQYKDMNQEPGDVEKREEATSPEPKQVSSNQDSDQVRPNDHLGFKEKAHFSNTFNYLAALYLISSMAIYLAGCIIDIYEVGNTRGEEQFVDVWSIVSIGQFIPKSSLDDTPVGETFIQVIWFFLGVVMTLVCSSLFLILYLVPMSQKWSNRIFLLAEISFSWSCCEVLLLSTIFAVLQLPTFGEGLVESDCDLCFAVDSKIYPEFAVFVVGAAMNVAGNIYLYRKAHKVIFGVF